MSHGAEPLSQGASKVKEQYELVLCRRAAWFTSVAVTLMVLQGNVEAGPPVADLHDWTSISSLVVQNVKALLPIAWTSLLASTCPREIPRPFVPYIMTACALLLAVIFRAMLAGRDNAGQALQTLVFALATVFTAAITATIWFVNGPAVWGHFRFLSGSFVMLRLFACLCFRLVAEQPPHAYPPHRLTFANAVFIHLCGLFYILVGLAPSARDAFSQWTGGAAVSLKLVTLCGSSFEPTTGSPPFATATRQEEHDDATSVSASSEARGAMSQSWCTESEASTFPDGTDVADLPLNTRHANYMHEVLQQPEYFSYGHAEHG